MNTFETRKRLIEGRFTELISRPNIAIEGNGIYERYQNPVLTSALVPLTTGQSVAAINRLIDKNLTLNGSSSI